MSKAIDLDRRLAERNAIYSSCCGFLGEVTLTDSAVIILLAGLLGAGDMLSIITTSLLPLFYGLLILPMAFWGNRIGIRRLILMACGLSAVAYFAAVSAPFFGAYGKVVLICSIVAFSLCLTGFIAGWFPLADTFLEKNRRITFFSRMRFCHQLTAFIFLFVTGLAIGAESPIWKLQLILCIAGIIYIGRLIFMAKIPQFSSTVNNRDSGNLRASLFKTIENKPLVGFSLYIFTLNLAVYGTVPLTILYLKKHLHAPDNIIVIMSSIAVLGMLIGYLCVGKIVKRIGVKHSLLLFHITFAIVNMVLFFINKGSYEIYALIGCLLLAYNFMIAAASVVTASEMMALSTPGDRVISMAFFGTFYFGGFGFSRLLTSLILGCGILANEWQIYSVTFCHYQSLFLLFTVLVIFAAVFLLAVPAIFPPIKPQNTANRGRPSRN